jgi:hypothetical protein
MQEELKFAKDHISSLTSQIENYLQTIQEVRFQSLNPKSFSPKYFKDNKNIYFLFVIYWLN